MSDFILPDYDDLANLLFSLGVHEDSDDFDAGLVMAAALPCGGSVTLIEEITNLPTTEVERWRNAMIREGVWPGLESWKADPDAAFILDLFAVVGKLRRIIYASGEVRYIDSRQPQAAHG